MEIRRPDGSTKTMDYYPKPGGLENGAQASVSATAFTDTFSGSAFSDREHRTSETVAGAGYSFTATPAGRVALYAASGVMREQMPVFGANDNEWRRAA